MNRGVPPERIILAIPPMEEERKVWEDKEEETRFETNEEKLKYAQMEVKHPEAFYNDPIVEQKIVQILRDLKIKVLEDHIIQKPDPKDNTLQSCLVKDEANCLEKVILTNMDPALSDEDEEEADQSRQRVQQ